MKNKYLHFEEMVKKNDDLTIRRLRMDFNDFVMELEKKI